MKIPISLDSILMNDSISLLLGIPHKKVLCTGVIDGTNKLFNVPEVPIYTRSGMQFNPGLADIDVFTRKSTTGESPVITDTPVVPTAINATYNSIAEAEIYQEIELTTAPATLDTDSIPVSYVEELEPFVQQDVTPSIKQTVKDVPRMGSVDNMRGYGTIVTGLKSEQTMSKETLTYINRLMYGTYQGDEDPVTGYTTTTMLRKPLSLFGCLLMDYEDEELGKVYLEGLTITPDLPGGKVGDVLKVTLDMNVAKLPNLCVPTPAV
jgi:hypothetical protein